MTYIGVAYAAQAQSYIDRHFIDTANSCADRILEAPDTPVQALFIPRGAICLQ
jgi:hypothetical protein